MSSMAVFCALGMPESKIEDSMGFERIYDNAFACRLHKECRLRGVPCVRQWTAGI